MSSQLGTISSSISALTDEYYTISNNLANINTTGFKRTVNSFSRELARQLSSGEEMSPLSGSIDLTSKLDFSIGTHLGTNRRLDTALAGKGFFVVETPDGPVYTRSGVFQLNSTGQLTNVSGDMVAGADGPIVIPNGITGDQLSIGADGNISSDGVNLGQIKIVDFPGRENELIPAGLNNYLAPKGLIPTASENPMVRQGYRENSNVQQMQEIVDLMMVSRLYSANVNLLKKRQENSRVMLEIAKAV
ncbi:MAG: flagellar hook basal-body protein [Planctomycetes bacterium]|nr:flagellar hook basal-body protein [Planctomycetota bacterium]